MRRGLSAATLVLSVLLLASGCGGAAEEAEEAPLASDATTSATAPSSGSTSPSSPGESAPTEEPPAPADDSVVVEVEVAGGSVTPDGERIGVDRGQVVEIVVTSDVDGELHVHSSPESYEQFTAGTSAIELQFDRPGLVDVELHAPFEGPVVQLEVS